MRKIILTSIFLLSNICVFAQMLQWRCDAQYIDIKYMGNDLFKVKTTNGKWGIINANGNMTINAQYDSITSLVNNRALLLDVSGVYLRGIVNEQGRLIRQFSGNTMVANYPYYREGMLAYGVPGDDGIYRFGYLDKNGNTRISPQFYWASPFHDGRAAVHNDDGYYMLINTSGSPAYVSDTKFYFVSAPVNNQFVVVKNGRRGQEIALYEITSDGKIDEVKTFFKKGGLVTVDYKKVMAPGLTLNFDNAMRLSGSSDGRHITTINERLDAHRSLENSALKVVKKSGAVTFSYNGKMLQQADLKDAEIVSDKYIVAINRDNRKGIMSLNQYGRISINKHFPIAEFYHRKPVAATISGTVFGVGAGTKIKLGIKGLSESGNEQMFDINPRSDGKFEVSIPYFVSASKSDVEITKPISANVYLDGLLYMTEECKVQAVHRKGFEIVSVSAPEYSSASGAAAVIVKVRALGGRPSSSSKVKVNASGVDVDTRKFGNSEIVTVQISLTVPKNQVKTIPLRITVTEEDCPAITETRSVTIKNYYLQ